MTTVLVHFKNNSKELIQFRFNVYNTDIAKRWVQCLKSQCYINNVIYEPDRVYNFFNEKWSEQKIVDDINRCIDIINSKEILINHRAYIGMTQDVLNRLHFYFEQLRGGILSPGIFWQFAGAPEKNALEQYNILIHRAENFNSNKNNVSPRIVCTFNGNIRHDLLDSDYNYFTLNRKFGEMYINYCEVGKPIYDVFKDNDEIVSSANIRPLKYYSPDFTVSFFDRSDDIVIPFLTRMDKWWDNNRERLANLGFIKGDPRNAIGNIPVAMIDTTLTQNQVIELISEYDTLATVDVL